MAAYANLVQETTTTTGTGTYSLGGAVAPNRTFVNGVGDGVETVYLVADGSGIYEIARGTVTAGSPVTLSRTAIIESVSTPGGTAGTSAINWGSGTKTVTMAVPASRLIAQAPDGASTVNLRAPLSAIDALTPAADRMIYYTGTSAAALLSCTSYGRSLLDAANASALRTLAGTVIGTDVQAYDADLAAIAGLVSAADKFPYATGSGTWAMGDITSAGRALIDDADAAAQRTTLGLAIGTDVQAYDADLAAIAGLSSAADKVPYATGAGAWALADFTASGRALTAVSSIALGDLIYGSGSNTVAKLAGNTTTTKKFLRMTGSGSAATAPAWDTLVNGDIPAALTGKTYNGLTVSMSTGTLTVPNGATFATSGAYSLTLTATAATNVTLPTTGTLATLAGTETFSNKTFSNATTFNSAITVTSGSTNGTRIIESGGTNYIQSGQDAGDTTAALTIARRNSTSSTIATFTVNAVSSVFSGTITAGSAAATVFDSAGVAQLRSFTVATVPSASPAGREIYVSNESGGAVTAFSDGTNWRRVTDRAIIS